MRSLIIAALLAASCSPVYAEGRMGREECQTVGDIGYALYMGGSLRNVNIQNDGEGLLIDATLNPESDIEVDSDAAESFRAAIVVECMTAVEQGIE